MHDGFNIHTLDRTGLTKLENKVIDNFDATLYTCQKCLEMCRDSAPFGKGCASSFLYFYITGEFYSYFKRWKKVSLKEKVVFT